MPGRFAAAFWVPGVPICPGSFGRIGFANWLGTCLLRPSVLACERAS